MVIRVYVTNICSSNTLKKEMLHVQDVLRSWKIEMDLIDISDPNREEDKKFMRANGEPKKDQTVALPPQIFNDDEFCGNYDTFFNAIEQNKLYQFLKMADETHVSQAQLEDFKQAQQIEDS